MFAWVGERPYLLIKPDCIHVNEGVIANLAIVDVGIALYRQKRGALAIVACIFGCR